ncbi:MAG: nucleotidyl transferase AbiEii/AbiGii toxin family protein [Candidatus Melainabacteria bacterium]|nr:nucleotidyl transferase AbiEii/AbiGii toxin family protein [Candidatus Melainabacteria bacterium]
MIPEAFIEEWKANAPWQTLAMIEQDMVISRVLIELYNHPKIKGTLIFRGGTALNKLYINPPARYSEDIDLVQIKSEPIGKTIDFIRSVLDSWLGKPNRKLTERSAKLIYKFESVDRTIAKLKIEINTTEHFYVQKLKTVSFSMNSEWFNGTTQIFTYELEELIATKLRALYQRRKGRDLFDLWLVLKQNLIDANKVISTFKRYCIHNNQIITRDLFEQNLMLKRNHRDFAVDIKPLLAQEVNWNPDEAFELINKKIISRLKD